MFFFQILKFKNIVAFIHNDLNYKLPCKYFKNNKFYYIIKYIILKGFLNETSEITPCRIINVGHGAPFGTFNKFFLQKHISEEQCRSFTLQAAIAVFGELITRQNIFLGVQILSSFTKKIC